MCNRVHEQYEIIDEKGTGWKIFTKVNKSYATLFQSIPYKNYHGVPVREKEFSEWKTDDPYDNELGFCFFLSRQEAENCLFAMVKFSYVAKEIVEIEYEGGMVKQMEENMIHPCIFEIALARRIRPVNGW